MLQSALWCDIRLTRSDLHESKVKGTEYGTQNANIEYNDMYINTALLEQNEWTQTKLGSVDQQHNFNHHVIVTTLFMAQISSIYYKEENLRDISGGKNHINKLLHNYYL